MVGELSDDGRYQWDGAGWVPVQHGAGPPAGQGQAWGQPQGPPQGGGYGHPQGAPQGPPQGGGYGQPQGAPQGPPQGSAWGATPHQGGSAWPAEDPYGAARQGYGQQDPYGGGPGGGGADPYGAVQQQWQQGHAGGGGWQQQGGWDQAPQQQAPVLIAAAERPEDDDDEDAGQPTSGQRTTAYVLKLLGALGSFPLIGFVTYLLWVWQADMGLGVELFQGLGFADAEAEELAGQLNLLRWYTVLVMLVGVVTLVAGLLTVINHRLGANLLVVGVFLTTAMFVGVVLWADAIFDGGFLPPITWAIVGCNATCGVLVLIPVLLHGMWKRRAHEAWMSQPSDNPY